MLKVTVVVETSGKYGHSEQFRAEMRAPEHSELRGWAPIDAEHLIAEVGAHLVRKVAAVYGDHRDDVSGDLRPLLMLRPLTDYDKAREGTVRARAKTPAEANGSDAT